MMSLFLSPARYLWILLGQCLRLQTTNYKLPTTIRTTNYELEIAYERLSFAEPILEVEISTYYTQLLGY
jgi:hypothetical protein